MKKFVLFIALLFLFSCGSGSKTETFSMASVLDFSVFEGKIAIDSNKINQLKNEDLKLFYKKYEYATVWHNEDFRASVLAEIKKAEEEGLESTDYNYKFLYETHQKYDALPDSTLINYDINFTENFQKYITHLSKGKINPNTFYKDCDLGKKEIDVNKIAFESIDKNNFSEVLENCKPQHIIYKKLKWCLKKLKNMPNDNFGVIDLSEKIVFNKKNRNVPLLKKKLMYWGDMAKKDTILSTVYDKDTQEAVKKFQERHGLKPDGVVGKSTLDALNYSRDQRIEQIVANLERWRWFQHDFGNSYLLINIPDYTVVAVKDNDTLIAQKVVVGKDTRRTPMLESKITNINLNPNWTVPPTILKEDIFPEAEKDRGEFKKRGLVILDKKNNEVNPWTWKKEDANKYKYVQNPGENNSLGLMKINFLNKFAVYLHDTNHRDYFKYTYRALSSGCVRLEKPLEMATYLLNDNEKWPIEKIQDTTNIKHYIKLQKEKEKEYNKKVAKLLAKNPTLEIPEKKWPKPELKTIVIKIDDDIKIHQLYWTAWEKDETLQFREDIYCLDHDIFAKLRYKK